MKYINIIAKITVMLVLGITVTACSTTTPQGTPVASTQTRPIPIYTSLFQQERDTHPSFASSPGQGIARRLTFGKKPINPWQTSKFCATAIVAAPGVIIAGNDHRKMPVEVYSMQKLVSLAAINHTLATQGISPGNHIPETLKNHIRQHRHTLAWQSRNIDFRTWQDVFAAIAGFSDNSLTTIALHQITSPAGHLLIPRHTRPEQAPALQQQTEQQANFLVQYLLNKGIPLHSTVIENGSGYPSGVDGYPSAFAYGRRVPQRVQQSTAEEFSLILWHIAPDLHNLFPVLSQKQLFFRTRNGRRTRYKHNNHEFSTPGVTIAKSGSGMAGKRMAFITTDQKGNIATGVTINCPVKEEWKVYNIVRNTAFRMQ